MTWKGYLRLVISVFLLILVQTSVLPVFLEIPAPALVLMFPLALFSLGKNEEVFFAAFIGGLMFDLIGEHFLGRTSLIFVSTLLLAFYVKKYLFDNILLYFFVIALFSFGWVYLALGSFPEHMFGFFILNLISFGLFYLLVRRFDRESAPF